MYDPELLVVPVYPSGYTGTRITFLSLGDVAKAQGAIGWRAFLWEGPQFESLVPAPAAGPAKAEAPAEGGKRRRKRRRK